MPKSPSKKTLAAQAIQRGEQADRLFRYQTVSDRHAEATRGALYSGLGGAQQLSGAYAGVAPRDYSKYSQGLIFKNDFLGGQVQAWRELKAAGADPSQVFYREKDKMALGGATQAWYGAKITSGGGREGQGTLDSYLDESGKPVKMKGSPFKFKKGQPVDKNNDGVFDEQDFKKRFSTWGEQAAKGKKGAISKVRSWELAGQIVEVQDLFEQANTLARAGDFDAADEAHAQALALVDEYGLNEQFDPTDLKKKGKGLSFSIGDVYDPMTDVEGQAGQALGSPTGMLVGEMVSTARQMQDPNSAESERFRKALTADAEAALDASRQNALRAMATEERGAARSMRDLALSQGSASGTARLAAVAARNAERFAAQRATLETDVGARKSALFAESARLYEQFRVDLGRNAVQLASAWVNDQSGVRDSFRAMHANMMMSYTSNLLGFASSANNNVTQLLMSSSGDGGGGTAGIAGGALGGAASGAAIGTAITPGIGTAVGAIGGAIVGGLAGS